MIEETAALAYINRVARFSVKKREDIDQIVGIKFKKVLEDALVNCGFYQERKIPFQFLTKEEVRNNIYAGMVSPKYANHPGLVFDRTSGSAGDTVPFAYLQGFHRYARMVFSFLINTDWKWGEKHCVFTTVHCSKERCSIDEGIPYYVNRIKIPTSDDIFTDKEILDKAGAILKENRGRIVHGDPFYLCAVASHFDAKGERIVLKGISSTYELLTPYVRRYLEKIFRCRVFDSYGSSEFGPIAFACQRGAKHIFEESIFVEIADKGQYLDPEVGEIVVTSLENFAMPLIRYRTGDVGKLITGACACKRTAKMLEIYGRDSQRMSLNGVLYSERDIAHLMDIPGVLLYQMNQSSGDLAFHILLEKGYTSNARKKEIEKRIKDKFIKLEAGGMSVAFVNYIKPQPSGKFKTVI